MILHSVDWPLFTDVLGIPNGPVFKGQAVYEGCSVWPLKIGQIGIAETSVYNHQSTPIKIPEHRGFLFYIAHNIKCVKNSAA